MIKNFFFDFRLTLPDDLKATDIKWLSVWDRRFQVNFADMFFPEDLSFEDKGNRFLKHIHPPEI